MCRHKEVCDETAVKGSLSAVVGLAAFGVLVFVPAGTTNYWQGWAFLAVFALSTWFPTLYLMRTDPAALERRMQAGPKAETRPLQRMVRHPMYTGNVVLMLGIPLALGSYWGLFLLIPGLLVLVLRIRDEESLLEQELDGYREYEQKVRYRLLPYVW